MVNLNQIPSHNSPKLSTPLPALEIKLHWTGMDRLNFYAMDLDESVSWDDSLHLGCPEVEWYKEEGLGFLAPSINSEHSYHNDRKGRPIISSTITVTFPHFSSTGLKKQVIRLGVHYLSKFKNRPLKAYFEMKLYGEMFVRPCEWEFENEGDFLEMLDIVIDPVNGASVETVNRTYPIIP